MQERERQREKGSEGMCTDKRKRVQSEKLEQRQRKVAKKGQGKEDVVIKREGTKRKSKQKEISTKQQRKMNMQKWQYGNIA